MNANKWKVLDKRLQQCRTFHLKILNYSVDLHFKLFHGLSSMFLVENNKQQPALPLAWFSVAKYIYP